MASKQNPRPPIHVVALIDGEDVIIPVDQDLFDDDLDYQDDVMANQREFNTPLASRPLVMVYRARPIVRRYGK